MRSFWLRLVLVAGLVGLAMSVGSPAHAECGVQADLGEVVEECDQSSAAIEAEKEKYPTAKWTVRQLCKDDSRTPESLSRFLCKDSVGVHRCGSIRSG